MIPNDRKNEIISILKLEGYCTVEHLAQSVFVSVPTMRRDLTQLEKEGFVIRTHGGAQFINGEGPMQPFDQRNRAMNKEKMQIGVAAAKLINDYDTVFFDSCSSCLCLAKNIDSQKRFNALTNSIAIAQTLSNNKYVNVELVGGTYDQKSLSIYGDEALTFVSKRHAKYCFLTANSVDKDFGFSNITEFDVPLKKAFAKNADNVVLLIDSSRLNRKNFYKVFDFNEIDILITDKDLDDELNDVCAKNNIRVIIAE